MRASLQMIDGLRKSSKDPPPKGRDNASSQKLKANSFSLEPEQVDEEESTSQKYFHRAIQLAIVVNSAQMGLELNFRQDPWPKVWEVSDHFFTAFFLGEALLKLYQYRLKYFTEKPERTWNCLDFFVVNVTVLDLWILQGASDLDFVRVIRLVRLSRVLRLLKEQKDLMMVVIGIVGSLKSMAWVGVLLLVVVYATAIACCTLIGDSDVYSEDNPEVNFSDGGQVSLQRAMFTLLNLSLGQGHMETFNPMYDNHIYLLPFMFSYVMLVTVGILNAIIGIICEKTADAGRASVENEKWMFRDMQRTMVDTLKTLIWTMNEDDDGIISQEELNAASGDPKFVEMLKDINLPSSFTVADMHLMLDKDGDGELTEEEFADGMYDLVYSDDFQRQCILLRSLACAKRNMHDFREEIKSDLQDIRKLLLAAHKPGGAMMAPTVISPGPPGDSPMGLCVGAAWEVMGDFKPMPVPQKFDADCIQDSAALKQVRTNALKAVAAGAWDLLEQEGAVQKELVDAAGGVGGSLGAPGAAGAPGNLAAMKQVRARALKMKAERDASREGSNQASAGLARISTAPAGMQSSDGSLFSGGCFGQPPSSVSMEAYPAVSRNSPHLPGTPEVTVQAPSVPMPRPPAREEL